MLHVVLEGGQAALYHRDGTLMAVIDTESIYEHDKGLEIPNVFRTEDGGASWSPLAKLTPSDGVEDAEFGSSVAVHGNFVAAGAPDDDEYWTASSEKKRARAGRMQRPLHTAGPESPTCKITAATPPHATRRRHYTVLRGVARAP